MSDWQPIETAPTDGTILKLKGVYPRHHVVIETNGLYESGGYTEGWVDERYNQFWPTHWMPSLSSPLGDWKDIGTAPRDRQFLALDACGEVFVARCSQDGRLTYRMHGLRVMKAHRIVQIELDGERVAARVPIEEPSWTEVYEHTWVLWTRGFELAPVMWAELPARPSSGDRSHE